MNDLKVFYMAYTKTVHIVWLDTNPLYNRFIIYKDGEEIFNEVRSDSLHRPTEFDHDRHTNLYFKRSNHEYCVHDTEVLPFTAYKYKLVCIRESDDGEILDQKESDYISVYTE